MCLVGHQKYFVFSSEWDHKPSEEWYKLIYLKRINLEQQLKLKKRVNPTIALEVNQREQSGNKDTNNREDGVLDKSGSSGDAENCWSMYSFNR